MKPFKNLAPYDQALALIDSRIQPLIRTEFVKIDYALNRVLANDFVTTINVPAFTRASMDGFAARYEDIAPARRNRPVVLEIVGHVYAGDPTGTGLTPGKCVQIATGAVLPRGADVVIKLEDVRSHDGSIEVPKASPPGTNLGMKGEDIKAGHTLLKKGTVIDANKIPVLASQGKTRVEVYARPEIAVMPSGNEVIPLGKKLRRGQLYDTNSYSISAVIQENGGVPVSSGIVKDRADVVRGTIAAGLEFDMVVISGGSSVGERDLVAGVLEGWGEILFHGVGIRPGKPALFAVVEGKPVYCLPGYPTASLMSAHLLVVPAIRKLARLPAEVRPTVTALLSQNITVKPGLKQFLPVSVSNGRVTPVADDYGAIGSLANADGYITITENVSQILEGETVTVTLF